jgi:hypothetical protein
MPEPTITPGPVDSWPALQDATRDNLAMLCDYSGTYPDEVLHALCDTLRHSLRAERAYLDLLLIELQNYRSRANAPEGCPDLDLDDDLPFDTAE